MKHFPGSWFRVVTTLSHNPLTLLAGVLLCLAPSVAPGQDVSFAGALTTLPFSGLCNEPFGIAVDHLGDVFVLDSLNSRVVELPQTATGYGPQVTITSFPVSYGAFYGIAVDLAGNLFVTLEAGVAEVPWTGTAYGPQVTLPLSGVSGPRGVAVDSAGDVFVADTDNGRVVELPWTGTAYGPQTTLPASLGPNPEGVAVDSAGDVFIADFDNSRVVELPKTSTGYGPQTTLPVTDLPRPSLVAIDSAGDVFVVNSYSRPVYELPKTATGYGPQTTLPLLSDSFDTNFLGIAGGSAGDVFVAVGYNVGDVTRVQTHSVNFGGANVCAPGTTTPAPCSQTLTLTYNVNANTTLGEPQVATGGLKYLDFNRASGSTCIGAVTAGTTCTVNVTFAPLAAGFRHGSVSLPDGSGHGIATVELSGFGIAATTGAPVAQLSTSKLSFGAIDFGTTKTFPLFVANIGGGTLTVAPSISGPSYKIADSTCAAGVTPGNSCTLVVEYSPVSIGPHDDTLTVATNGGSPTVGLFGSVAGLSVLGGVSGATLEFGTVSSGSAEVELLTVTNVGLPGTVTVGTAISGLSFSVLTTGQNTCLAGIAAGQSCTLPIEFAPTKSGLHDEPLTLTPFPGGGSTTVWLNGSTP